MQEIGKHGITADTPKKIPFGAGVFYRNLRFTDGKWKGEPLCATKEGSSYELGPEHLQIELDGMLIPVEGADAVTGWKASFNINVGEYKEEVIIDALHLKEVTDSTITGFKKYKPVVELETGSYVDDLGFVGYDTSNNPLIIIFDKALCTSGMSGDNKPKTQGSFPVTYEARGNMTKLEEIPVTIYMPTRA